MLDLKAIRNEFPMLRNATKMQGHDLVWLDNASTTFKPDAVLEAVTRYYTSETSNSHRGDYDLCYNMDQEVLKTRKAVASFIHCDPSEVVFTSGATMSLNLVAFGYAATHLGKDDEILLTEAEHASNILPWYKVAEITGCKVRFIPLDKQGRLTPENLENAFTSSTKLVCVAHVSNVLGYVTPIKELASICHKHGALICVDGAQSVPHFATDVKDLDCDFLAFSGHKLCGPTGIGVLYGKFDLLRATDAFMSGGGMNVKFDKQGGATYLEPPARFEAGTQNLEGIMGLGAAIEFINRIGIDNVAMHERELKRYAVKKILATGKATVYNPDSESGIVTFNVDGVFAQDAATYFNSKGIACRSGQHCAKVLNDFLGTVATVRASFYLYTTKEDIDALVDAIDKCKGEFLNAYF